MINFILVRAPYVSLIMVVPRTGIFFPLVSEKEEAGLEKVFPDGV